MTTRIGRAREAAALSVGYATVRTYERMFVDHGFGDRLGPIGAPSSQRTARRWPTSSAPTWSAPSRRPGRWPTCAVDRYRGHVDRMWLVSPHHHQDAEDTRRWQREIISAFGRA